MGCSQSGLLSPHFGVAGGCGDLLAPQGLVCFFAHADGAVSDLLAPQDERFLSVSGFLAEATHAGGGYGGSGGSCGFGGADSFSVSIELLFFVSVCFFADPTHAGGAYGGSGGSDFGVDGGLLEPQGWLELLFSEAV